MSTLVLVRPRPGFRSVTCSISVNGYLTEQRGNLAWIIANATPGNELKLVVRTMKDGKDHTVLATI